MKKNFKLLFYLGLSMPFLAFSAISCSPDKKNIPPDEGHVDVEPNVPVFNNDPVDTNYGNIPGKPKLSKAEYDKLSESERNRVDLEAYSSALQQALGSKYPSKEVPLLTGDKLKTYNEKASLAGQPDYESAYRRNFSLVSENNNLILNPLQYQLTAAYWNSTPGNRGLPRWLPNDLYKSIALQSFAIAFNNVNSLIDDKSSKQAKGTAWILDYELDDNGYPTKWYLATNLHVAAALTKTTADGRFSNVVDLEAEKATYDQWKTILDETTAYYEELVKPFQERRLPIENEIERLQSERRKVETDAVGAEGDQKAEYERQLAKYDQLINEQYEKLEVIGKEESAALEKNWYANEKSAQYTKASKKIQSYLGLTQSIKLEHFNEDTPLRQDLKINADALTVDTFLFDPDQVKIVYAANDFLTSSPKNYLDVDSPYKDLEEMADFAVLEFDFTNSKNSYKYISKQSGERIVANAHDLAKKATSNFANWNASKKFKFATNSLKAKVLENSNDELIDVTTPNGGTTKIPKSLVNLLALGFPNSASDNKLDTREMTDVQREGLKYTQSLWVNKPYYINPTYKEAGKSFTVDYGAGLNKTLALRNTLEIPGITDITITSPILNAAEKEAFDANFLKDTQSSYKGHNYINYGLGYSLGAWQPLEGASGSSIRTIDNEIVGINFASLDAYGNSLASIIQAFRSEGDDYKGFYGNYKLEQYDLIYGGGRNQRTSYRQALKDFKNSETVKTYLFSNGLQDENVPKEYKFNK
ncbi:Ig-specific serine endopeptidase MIP [Mycoplasmopsis columbina]|uniref:Ig-specific serine endopeptidase MIP n=1 Tax=Mycoplasmopsis columbina TaxID=114881 RepID=UPI0006924457|nr:DUF31 family protein [Mycoplasmopsis columbina]VEU76656.1 Membrane-associated lipoprotein precursor [Mycoplasmopsis columbina]